MQEETVRAQTNGPHDPCRCGGPGRYPRRWLMLPVVLIAMFMAGFDARIETSIRRHFGRIEIEPNEIA